MPHKVTTVGLLDAVSVAVEVAGSCNAILRRPDGSLYGDMFDGAGFTRAARRDGFEFAGADCLVVGAGGVGSAIAAAIAAEGPRLDRAVRHPRGGGGGLAAPLAAALSRRCGQARRQRPGRLSTWSSTRRRSAWRPAIRCRSTPDAPRSRRAWSASGARAEMTPLLQAARPARLPLPGRHRHAVRADPGLSRIFRLRHRHARRTARGGENLPTEALPALG